MASATELNRFGLGLFQLLSAEAPSEDVVISPFSIKLCLSMVAAGATEGSDTEKEMAAVLGEPSQPPPPDSAMEVANSAWLRGSVKEDYVQMLRETFAADALPLTELDPAPINAWAAEKTKGRITNLLKDLDPVTVMVLVNTVFFKGSWSEHFDVAATKDGKFTAFSGALPCKMMYKEDKRMMYTQTEQFQAVRLPYAAGDMSATILLPQKEGHKALEGMIADLSPATLASLHAQLGDRTHVELRMPRFKLDFEKDLKQALSELGMPTPFKEDLKDAFLRMSDDPLIYINQVAHKASVEVNEEGTVAAAATAAVMASRCMPPPPQMVTVDRPFLFLISNKDGGIVFLSKVVGTGFGRPE